MFVLLSYAVSLQAETLKIGVFDIQKVLVESRVIKEYRQKIGKEMEGKRKAFADKQEAAKQIEENLKARPSKLSLNDRKKLEEKLANEVKELRRLKEDMDSELQKIDRELSQQALRDIDKIVKEIANTEGYTIIFEKAAAGIVHFRDSVDITSRVIKTYDKQ